MRIVPATMESLDYLKHLRPDPLLQVFIGALASSDAKRAEFIASSSSCCFPTNHGFDLPWQLMLLWPVVMDYLQQRHSLQLLPSTVGSAIDFVNGSETVTSI